VTLQSLLLNSTTVAPTSHVCIATIGIVDDIIFTGGEVYNGMTFIPSCTKIDQFIFIILMSVAELGNGCAVHG
jgi:hypothetical protein